MSAQDSDPWLSVTNGKLLLHYYTLYFLFYEATLVTTFSHWYLQIQWFDVEPGRCNAMASFLTI